jgi:hypothetical protein
MAETLRTIPHETIDEFLDLVGSFTGQTIFARRPCVLFLNTKQNEEGEKCPDNKVGGPYCGACVIAKADQRIIISDIVGRGNFHEETRSRSYLDNKILKSRLRTNNEGSLARLTIEHDEAGVELEYWRNDTPYFIFYSPGSFSIPLDYTIAKQKN